MYRTLSVVAVVLTAAMSFAPAVAGNITVSASSPSPTGTLDVRSMKVSLDEVDLNTAQGAATVLDRIEGAARIVCGEREGYTMKPARAKLFETCRTRVVHYAVKEVDVPELTQLAAKR